MYVQGLHKNMKLTGTLAIEAMCHPELKRLHRKKSNSHGDGKSK